MSASSSPDPLALSPVTSPTRSNRRRNTKGPLASRSSNYKTSPVRSMLLEPKDAKGSPWRIKVTVQAEATSGSCKPTTKTATISLHDTQPTPSSQRRERTQPTPSAQHGDIPELCPVSQLGGNASTDYSLSEIEFSEPNFAHDQDEEPDAVLGAYAPGDATVLESEEFSIISVDSLTSNRIASYSSPSQAVNVAEQDSAPEQSYMPSSPPPFITDRITPLPSDSPPKGPAAPLAVPQQEANVETPLRESARKSGRALQDALNGPFRTSVSREAPARESVFSSFGSGSRRQLRQNLQNGQDISSQPLFGSAIQNMSHLAPQATGRNDYLSPFQSPVRQERQSEGRQSHLLTPETDTHTRFRGGPTSASEPQGEVNYPTINGRVQQETQNVQHSAPKPESRSHTAADHDDQLPIFQDGPSSKDAQKEDDDRDIWQEEASRSFDNEASPQQTDLFLEDLPVKPLRGKLPGTWRHTSGADFHYSDSPKNEERNERKISGSTVESSRKSSGVLTPPSSEDGNTKAKEINTSKPIEDQAEESDESDVEETDMIESPNESVVSEDDTGMFWQANLPAMYIRNKGAPSPAKSFAPSSPLRNTILDISPIKGVQEPSPLSMAPVMGHIQRSPKSSSRTMSSPLRRSLLRSSKMHGNSPVKQIRESRILGDESEKTLLADESEQSETQTDSSLASDIRQLNREMKAASSAASTDGMRIETPPEREDSVYSLQVDNSRSYQEELNRDSPVRIKVNFNDSSGNSSLLEPKKAYPPLFGNIPNLAPKAAVVSLESPQPPSPKIMSRLTDSFWEAVTKKPVYAPEPKPKPMIVRESATTTSLGVPDHVLRLRRKYGLLPDVHPFTYAHVRTLHRMANSIRSRPGASIIPRSGPLSHGLSRLLGKTKTNDLDQRLIWTGTYLHVVDAFMSLLLPSGERERLQETGTWGDAEAIKHRDVDSKGRHGKDVVFEGVRGCMIEACWVADVLADIVFKEEMNAKKKKIAEMVARAEKWERMEK